MKEFNKWWEQHKYFPLKESGYYPTEETIAEVSWEAALKYALSTRASSHRNIISAEFLKKELRGD